MRSNIGCATTAATIAGRSAARCRCATTDGAIIRWIGTCTDIDERKRQAEQNEILSRELSHRIKNIFAVIGGLIGLSARQQPEHQALRRRPAASASPRWAGRTNSSARTASDRARPTGPRRSTGLLREILTPYPA